MEKEFTEVSRLTEDLRVKFSIEVYDTKGFIYASFCCRDLLIDAIDVVRYLELGFTVKYSKL